MITFRTSFVFLSFFLPTGISSVGLYIACLKDLFSLMWSSSFCFSYRNRFCSPFWKAENLSQEISPTISAGFSYSRIPTMPSNAHDKSVQSIVSRIFEIFLWYFCVLHGLSSIFLKKEISVCVLSVWFSRSWILISGPCLFEKGLVLFLFKFPSNSSCMRCSPLTFKMWIIDVLFFFFLEELE